MIESAVAAIRNMGEKVCGTITPVFEFQSKGATGAGVTSIYEFCSGEGAV